MRVAVVGAGVIARSVALELARSGAEVFLFAPASLALTSASRASGAMLGAFAEYTAEKDTVADRAEGALREAAGRRWERWFDDVTEGAVPGAVRRGTFIVASNNGLDDVRNVEHIQARAQAAGERNAWVDAAEVPGLEPHRLSRPVKVLALPDEGFVDSGAVLGALDVALAAQSSVSVVDDVVASVSTSGRRPSVRTRSGETYAVDRLVVAAGAATAALLPGISLGAEGLTLLGGRGASIVVETEVQLGGVLRTPNRDFACGTHVVPLGGGRVYLGATNRLEPDPTQVPRISLGELHSLAHSLSNEINVRLRTAAVIETRAGFRPIVSDGYPLFGATGHPDVFVATGTYRNGMLMAPVIAETVAADVVGAFAGDNPFAPATRDKLHVDRDVTATVLASLRQIVSFIQEPDGNLPFERAGEIESLLRAFLSAGLGLPGGQDVIDRFERLTARYPISEAMPLLMYEVAESSRVASAPAVP